MVARDGGQRAGFSWRVLSVLLNPEMGADSALRRSPASGCGVSPRALVWVAHAQEDTTSAKSPEARAQDAGSPAKEAASAATTATVRP